MLITGCTAKQTQKIKAIQKGIHAYEDGIFGNQTLDCLYQKFTTPVLPYTEYLFGAKVIFADKRKIKFLDVADKRSCNDYPNSTSGTFSWRYTDNNGAWNVDVSSILSSNDFVFSDNACHSWLGYPESVLYADMDYNVKLARIKHINELEPHKWAIGGLGLTNYDLEAEGFCKIPNTKYDFSDVTRYTHHIGIGINEYDNICIFYNISRMSDFKKLSEQLRLKYAISLDGGHIPSLNCLEFKHNLMQKQSNIITF